MDAAKGSVLGILATCLLKQRDAEKNNIKCVPEPHSNIKHTLQARCNSMWKPTLNTHLMKLCGQGGTPSQSTPPGDWARSGQFPLWQCTILVMKWRAIILKKSWGSGGRQGEWRIRVGLISYFEGRLQQNVKVQGLQGCSRTWGL